MAPDAVSYNTVISAHERAGEWREALDLARKMERLDGIVPTVVTFNSVIGACKQAGRPTEALAVLGLLRRKGLLPDVISFNSAMSACARCDARLLFARCFLLLLLLLLECSLASGALWFIGQM